MKILWSLGFKGFTKALPLLSHSIFLSWPHFYNKFLKKYICLIFLAYFTPTAYNLFIPQRLQFPTDSFTNHTTFELMLSSLNIVHPMWQNLRHKIYNAKYCFLSARMVSFLSKYRQCIPENYLLPQTWLDTHALYYIKSTTSINFHITLYIERWCLYYKF